MSTVLTPPKPVRARRPPPATDEARRSAKFANWCIALLLAIVLEGAVRKWMLPDSLHFLQAVPYLSKDAIGCLMIVLFPIPARSSFCQKLRLMVVGIGLLLTPAAVVGAVISVPNAVITYKNAVLWPLIALTIAANITPLVIKRLTLALVILCVLSAGLGALQYASPPTARINSYAWNSLESDISAFAGDKVRATGTFSYISGFTAFGLVSFCWFFWRYLSGEENVLLMWMGIASTVIISLSTGSRAPIVESVSVLFISQLTLTSAKARMRSIVVVLGLFVFGGVLLVTTDLLQSWWQRWTTANDTVEDRVLIGGWEFANIVMENPLGRGLGEQSQLAAYKSAQSGSSHQTIYVDDNRSRVSDECGVAGLLALAVTVIMVCAIMLRNLIGKNKQAYQAVCVFGVPTTWAIVSCVWYDHNATALWWLCVAAVLGVGEYRRSGAPVGVRRQAPVAVPPIRQRFVPAPHLQRGILPGQ